MRLLLDAHVSGRVIGAVLREQDHDVSALGEHPHPEGLTDRQVLDLACQERRVLVTFDVKDFAPLKREWTESGQSHAGAILVTGLDHREFGRVVEGLAALFGIRPQPEDWENVAVFLTKRAT